MEPNIEIRRLLDLMPASGRMMTKIVSKPEQKQVIDAAFPLPLSQARPIYINFDLWRRLPKPQRDLLLLQRVCWLTGGKMVTTSYLSRCGVSGACRRNYRGSPI